MIKLFGRKSQSDPDAPLLLRPMKPLDVPRACEIIAAHDEDDAEEAHVDFTNGHGRNFVFARGREIVGCCGYSLADDTLGAAWLSWTYIAPEHQRRGHGTDMLLALRNYLEGSDVRRLFVDTSDYTEDGVDIYLGARNFYEHHLQARREIVIPDFYQPGENKYIYSLPVLDFGQDDEKFAGYDEPDGHVEFRDIFTAAETETGAIIGWGVGDFPGDQLGDLARLIERARGADGHLLTISLPGGLAARHSHVLAGAGLANLGRVRDYYAPGVDDEYWGIDLLAASPATADTFG